MMRRVSAHRMNMMLAVAVGGALGAVARYWMIGQFEHWFGHGFPWGTLGVNVLGAFALGVVVEFLALAWSPPPEISAVITVGILGAFTTFSAFSVDLLLLIERGQGGLAGVYALASVAFALGGLFAGLRLTRLALVLT